MSEVYCRVCDEQNLDSPACLANVTPKKIRKPPHQPTLLKTESELEVPGKNGNKLTDLVNSKPKEEEKKRRSSFVEKRKSENIEFEIADDASSLNDENTDLISKPTKLGNIEDTDPALVMVNGTEELPSVEVTSDQKTVTKVNVNIKNTTSVKIKDAKKTDQSNKNVWSRLSAQKKSNSNSRATKINTPKRDVAKATPKEKVQKDKKSVKPIVNMMKQTNIKDSNKTASKKTALTKKSKDIVSKVEPKIPEVEEKTTDVENNIISNEIGPSVVDATENNIVDASNSDNSHSCKESDGDAPNSNGLSDETTADIVNNTITETNSNSNSNNIVTSPSDNIVTSPSFLNDKFDSSQNYEMIDEMTRFKRNFDHTASHITTVKVGDRTYCTLPKRKRDSVHHSMWYRETIRVPMRTTPDGTDIYYWCDISKEHDKDGKNNFCL